jgi:site-specific recombinase XerD
MSEDLEPLAPSKAFEMWLDRQRSERAESTVESYKRRAGEFVEWCQENAITNLNDLTGRDLVRFDSYLRSRDLAKNTLNNRLGTIRQFLEFCENADAVPEGTAEAVDVPKLTKEEYVNTVKLPSGRAESLLTNLDRFHYASLDHALVQLMWRTTARVGALRALDTEDIYLTEDDVDRIRYQQDVNAEEESLLNDVLADVEPPFLWIRHREETPLKNKEKGERPIALRDDTGEVLRGYLNVNRPDVTDENGRKPLFASKKSGSRLSISAMRNRLYRLTRPCIMGGDCPHDRDPETCEGMEHGLESRCPSTRSPHKVRTGSITWHRDRGWPVDDLAEKANTSPRLIRSVYDQPEQLRRMATRQALTAKLGGADD